MKEAVRMKLLSMCSTTMALMGYQVWQGGPARSPRSVRLAPDNLISRFAPPTDGNGSPDAPLMVPMDAGTACKGQPGATMSK